ncbi:MAG: transcription-repair coupling factor [Clostridia bacterium]|nr:transcription-repair coupling factor [Clostridia bacterium]
MLKEVLRSKKRGGVYGEILSCVCDGLPIAVFGGGESEKARLISSLNSGTLVIVKDVLWAKKLAKLISSMTGEDVVFLPPKDDVLLYKSTFDKESLFKRLTALYKLQNGAKTAVTTIEALLQLFPKKVDSLTFKKGCDYELDTAVKSLVKLGYKRVEVPESAGTFSLRGDILLIYPINDETVYRLDFFGDELESIRRAGTEVDSVDVIIATDALILESEVESVKKGVLKSYKNYGTLLSGEKAKVLKDKLLEGLETDLYQDSLSYLSPLLSSVTHDFTVYLKNFKNVVFDEPKTLYDNLNYHLKEYADRIGGLLRSGEALDFISGQIATEKELTSNLSSFTSVAVQAFSAPVPFFNPLKTFNVRSSPVPRYFLKIEDLYSDLKAWQVSGYDVIICAGSVKNAETIYYDAGKHGIKLEYLPALNENYSGLSVTDLSLENGFINHNDKLAVIGCNDVFAKKTREKSLKTKRGDLFTAPEVGEFAVHEVFGVGLIKGVKRIATIEGAKDYVELEYADNDRLYVSTDQMDKLSRYLGGKGTPSLNRIGGGEFERIKERVKKAISEMTINLKKLYAERKSVKGFAFSPDNALTREFESAFGFEETEDQITSMEEIRQDMESDGVMDRLLCGDVGFGKTEVAFRAAFKAIMDGKQVAMVAPTTILTEQHYLTATARFEGFGVRIAVLNRFKTAREQKQILEKVASGEIDFVIGTHRLFSKDIKFSDLGLLIIDEEQRFGVEHKEKLKTLKSNVDTLALSATPIPRTLHMSLSGIRDISTINTPPKQRIPVQTVVTELTDSLLRYALTRELSRKGQAFVLYNRVESIYEFSARIKNIVPEASVIVAHGQMDEKNLENAVKSFYEGKADVLVATTIIENGIDLPRANTLIVESADKMGLSTLYQLKGRVGRGNLMAYAYFTYPENAILQDPSYKRLSALVEYSEMGSGYKIAMRDLELRGAGSLLGKQQHGHLDKVGYELYNKLLREELGEVTKNAEFELDVKADAYIPENYIASEKSRMHAYKLIAEIRTLQDKERVENLLEENFGLIPTVVKTLIDIAWVKVKAINAGAIKLVLSKEKCALTLRSLDSLKDGKIINKLKSYKGEVTLAFNENPVLVFNKTGKTPVEALALAGEFLSLN